MVYKLAVMIITYLPGPQAQHDPLKVIINCYYFDKNEEEFKIEKEISSK